MAKQKYLVSELDERTRQYLIEVRKAGGRDMSGIFMSGGPPIATWSFPVMGAVIVGVVLFCALPPLNHPTQQAMLLTAGLLLGGWLIVAGIRVMIAVLRGHNLGEFTYADPKQIWVVNNSVVERYPLKHLQTVAVDGKHLMLQYPGELEMVQVPFEVGILEIAAYVEYWLQVRGNGPHDQTLIEAHAASARAAAYDQTPDEQPNCSLDIPVPQQEETPRGGSRDWPILLGIAAFGVVLFFVIHQGVLIWHDHAVFDFVRTQSPAHWRAYLLDERNTRNREQVQKMLHERYQQKAEQLAQQILAKAEPGFERSDEAMTELLMALAQAPQPVVTLRIHDATDENIRQQTFPLLNPAHLQTLGQNDITDGLYTAVGQDLISLVQPLEEVPALLEIRFKFEPDKKQFRVDWTLAVRKDPDSEPLYKTAWSTNFQDANEAEGALVKGLQRIKNGLTGRN